MSQQTGRENELRAQGAAEAAGDPDSRVSARDAEQTMVNESKKAGAAAYQFDPNASPEEKAAQARSVSDMLQRWKKPKKCSDSSIVADTSGFSS